MHRPVFSYTKFAGPVAMLAGLVLALSLTACGDFTLESRPSEDCALGTEGCVCDYTKVNLARVNGCDPGLRCFNGRCETRPAQP